MSGILTGAAPGPFGTEGTVATLHGIYTLNRDVKIGAWVTRDNTQSHMEFKGNHIGSLVVYGKGVEVAYKTDALEVQGFWGTFTQQLDGEASRLTQTQTGISADYSFDNGFSLVAGMDRFFNARNDAQSLRNQFIGAEYEMANGAVLYAQRAATSETETESIGSWVSTVTSFGVRFDFGPNSGTTFRLRDVQDRALASP
jgi:hypothetical protein